MTQHLVWNFAFALQSPRFSMAHLKKEKEHLKWEIRYFWPDNQTIILNPISSSLFDLVNYTHKNHEDYYFLLPDRDYNVKQRHNQLLYKPLLKQSHQARAFGAKINIEPSNPMQHENPCIQEIMQRIPQDSEEVYVKKEAFTYKFPTSPSVKLELARLEVLNKVYFSVCIEGKSLDLVEEIAKRLLNKPVSCEYVSFLKSILHP